MKICMVLLNLGSLKNDARVRKEAASLAAAGHRVRLVAMLQKGEKQSVTLDGFELDLFPLTTRSLPGNVLLWLVKFFEFTARTLVRMVSFHAEAYHAHDLDTLIPAWIAARLIGAKIVYDSHELFTERAIPVRWFWRRVERYLITRVDAVIAANEDRAEVMWKEYGAREIPTVIMNCPYSFDGSEKGTMTLRQELPTHIRAKQIVLYQGGLSADRCLDKLVISAKHFDDRAVLVMVGRPSSFSENVLKRIVGELGLEGRVFFRDVVDPRKLVHFIASADIGVVIYENSCRNNYLCAPNKMFDYCMAGLPSIGCNFPPVRRIAETYGVVRLFDPEDPKSIAEAVNGFIRDPSAYAAAKKATRRVAMEFTWEREEKKLIALYSHLPGTK